MQARLAFRKFSTMLSSFLSLTSKGVIGRGLFDSYNNQIFFNCFMKGQKSLRNTNTFFYAEFVINSDSSVE